MPALTFARLAAGEIGPAGGCGVPEPHPKVSAVGIGAWACNLSGIMTFAGRIILEALEPQQSSVRSFPDSELR